METPIYLQGRWWKGEDIEAIRALIIAHPDWSRWRISRELSVQFGWRTATGQLRNMAARHLLARRSRNDRDHRLRVPIKDIYLYPLRSDFCERLCS